MDIEHLREWIGREEIASEMLTPALADRFDATFDRAGGAREGAVAPAMIHLCMAHVAVATSNLAADGHPPRGGFLPPVPLPRRMWAGGAVDFLDNIHVGETVERRSVIRDVSFKQGRSGPLCFVVVDHHFSSNGRKVLRERQDIVYRGADQRGQGESPAKPASSGAHRVAVAPSQALLFRYSALTFNSHRIHFDLGYAREIESYPGLIVHGPMQATMLVHFAEIIRGTCPRHFEFRSLSPLFDDADFTLNAKEDGDALDLWTSYADGPVAMQARAFW